MTITPRTEPARPALRRSAHGRVVRGIAANASGHAAERLVAERYAARGCEVLERCWRSPAGEVDLILRDGKTIVFVEVKTRSTPNFGGIEAISPRKFSRIRRAAAVWLAEHPAHSVRFDAVLVTPHAGHWSVECWEDIDRGAR